MNVLASLRFPEKSKGNVIFGSLKEDWAGGECGRGIFEGEKQGGVGSGQESNGHGGK